MKVTKRKGQAEKAEVDKSDTQSAKSGRSGRFSFRKKKDGKQQPEDDDRSWWPETDNEADAETVYSSSTGFGWREQAYSQKRVIYDHFGDFPKEVLDVNIAVKPKAENPTDVVIKVEASTVTLSDCLLRRGMCFHIFDPVCLPGTPGYDLVGVISEVGSGVAESEWKKGDRVAALVRTGGNARYAVVPSSSLVHVPKSLDAAEAACMVSTYMTAYQSLKMTLEPEQKKGAKPFEGKKILVVGGVGPVGQALVQLARKAGASEVYATGPKNRHRYMRTVMGAKPLLYETEEWLPQVKEQMDIVFDGSCQDGYTSSQAALNENGKLITLGMFAKLHQEEPGLFGAPLSAFMTDAKANLFMSKTRTYEVWSSFKSDPDTFKADLEKLFNKLKKNQIRPVIAKRIGLQDVADGHVFLEKGKARGPVVCIPWKRGPKSIREQDHIPQVIETPQREEARQEPEQAPPEEEEQEEKTPPKKRGFFRRRGDKSNEREDVQAEDTRKGKKNKNKGKGKKEEGTKER